MPATAKDVKKLKKLEDQVRAWNKAHAVGCEVAYFPVMRDGRPDAPGRKTKTRSEAWVLSDHSAVVMVKGVSGCVSLEHVFPRAEAEEVFVMMAYEVGFEHHW